MINGDEQGASIIRIPNFTPETVDLPFSKLPPALRGVIEDLVLLANRAKCDGLDDAARLIGIAIAEISYRAFDVLDGTDEE